MKESFMNFLKNLSAPTNRGILLDVLVFLLNVLLMRSLTANFIGLIQDGNASDPVAYYALFLFCLGILVLPPLGTTLKRWQFHRRRAAGGNPVDAEKLNPGYLFNPILYFCASLMIVCFIIAYIFRCFYADKAAEPDAGLFVSAVFGGIILAGLQTYVVYLYFSPPKKTSPLAFLRASNARTRNG